MIQAQVREPSMTDDLVETTRLGRRVVKDGSLAKLRKDLRPVSEHDVRVPPHKPDHVLDVGEETETSDCGRQQPCGSVRFYQQATLALEESPAPLDKLLPFHLAATLLGIPQELLLSRYRKHEVSGVDLGILGLWIWRDDLKGL